MASLKNTTINDTGFIRAAVGTTAQRPTASRGMIRFNSTTGLFEVYNGRIWENITAGAPISSGLEVYLDANDLASYPGSGTTWFDLTGNSRHGTLQNGPVYAGTSANPGRFFTFDGINDYVQFFGYSQPAQSSSTSFTWNTWVRPTRNDDRDIIMGNRGGGELRFTKLTSNNFEYYPQTPAATFGGAMPLNVWQNVCIVKSGSSFTYYRNGNVVTTASSTASQFAINFFVGGDPGAAEYAQLSIAVVGIYHRALSLVEVRQNFSALNGRFGV